MAERTEREGSIKQMGDTEGGAGPRGGKRGEGCCQPREERRGRMPAWVGNVGMAAAAATQDGGRAERREATEGGNEGGESTGTHVGHVSGVEA